jgi:predicted membrane protein
MEACDVLYRESPRSSAYELVADLPSEAPAEIVGTRAPEDQTSVFGDITVAGPSVPQRVSTVFGDVRMDLRGLRTGADRLDLCLTTFFGDVDVVVAEGVDAQIQGRTVFGDLKLRSLASGESASHWRQVMDRLAQASRSKGTAE